MTISNIAVYQPSTNGSSATWSQTSSWTAGQAGSENLVFMNNKGGGASGEWSGTCVSVSMFIQLLTLFAVCGGASQSYANGAWDDAAASPMSDVMSGTLPAGQEVVSG